VTSPHGPAPTIATRSGGGFPTGRPGSLDAVDAAASPPLGTLQRGLGPATEEDGEEDGDGGTTPRRRRAPSA